MRRVPWGSFLKRVYFTRSITQQQQWPQKRPPFLLVVQLQSYLGLVLVYHTLLYTYIQVLPRPQLSSNPNTHTYPSEEKNYFPSAFCTLYGERGVLATKTSRYTTALQIRWRGVVLVEIGFTKVSTQYLGWYFLETKLIS